MVKKLSTRELAYVALTGALSFVIMRLTQIPIFAAAPYLKLELSEAPIMLISVIVSPTAGLISLLLKDILGAFLLGYNLYGVSADILITGSFILLFTVFLKREKKLSRLIAATALAALFRMLVSIPVNLLVLWLEFGTPASGVFAAMPFILPFNLIKCIVNAALFRLLYPRLDKRVKK